MKLRHLKRRLDARTVYRALLWAHDPTLDWQWEECNDWDEDDGFCLDCNMAHDQCECHIGAECGRWRNGVLSDSCMKAGSEECDFECPYGR